MAIVLGIVVLVLMALCAMKESELTGLFKANKVYGRITAYLALDFTGLGLACIITTIIPSLPDMGLPLLAGLAFLAAGILLYALAFMKCPAQLKKRCIPSMIMSGLGVAIKICLFFLPFVWKLSGGDAIDTAGIPETVQDAHGHVCRTRVDGDFIYITRRDGTEDCIRRDYIDQTVLKKQHRLSTDSMEYRW